MAFGGGGGGYRHEHNSWSIGVLKEGEGLAVPPKWCFGGSGGEASTIVWGRPAPSGEGLGSIQPTPRCAHSATYIPSRLGGGPEGSVVIFGGHTDQCSESLATAVP